MLRLDCRNFPWERPCRFHKLTGTGCDSCNHYSTKGTRILIIKFAALGDVLRTTAVLPSLKHKYQQIYVTWITSPEAYPIFIGNDLVDEVVTSPDDYLPMLISVDFDVVINPDASPRSCYLASIAHAQSKFGFVSTPKGSVAPLNAAAARWLEMGGNDQIKRANRKTYQEILHEICGLEPSRGRIVLCLTDAEREAQDEIARALSLNTNAPLIGINTGAGSRWQLKKWHLGGFLEVIRMIRDQCGAQILLLGGKDEDQRNLLIKSHFGEGIYYMLPNDLREFFILIDLCDVVVTADTLALHAAVGLNKRVVALFGPTSPYEIEVYGLGRKIVPKIDCVSCYKQTCDIKPNCMDLITPTDVFKAVKEELEIRISQSSKNLMVGEPIG